LFSITAYEVLSDPDKKRMYDQSGGTFDNNNQNFNSHQHHHQDFNYNEFFKDFDEAMKRHHDAHNKAHQKAHREHMKAHREHLKNSGFTFDFDDLFDDVFGPGIDLDDDEFGSSFIQES
jgi:DnaJ-class molecular chaperone